VRKGLIKGAAIFVLLMTPCACVMPVSDQVYNNQVQLSHNSLFQENGLKEARFPITETPVSEPDDPPGPIAAKYAIVVGVGNFQETNITPLRYAQKDATTFYDYLLDPLGGDFKTENIFLILNEDATKPNIISALNQIKTRAEKNDLVLLFFSTHSTPPGKFGGVYIISYDTIVKPRESVRESSVSDEMLRDFINGIKAKRLVVIMDTCYSNGAYRQIGDKSLSVDDEGYGMSTVSGWGKVLFSSSTDGEKSWESDTLKNSFFTYYFIEGLKLYGNVKDAFYYATPKITEGVSKEKYAKQHPQVAADRKEWNIRLK